MPVTCFQVVDYGESPDGTLHVETFSLKPSNTNLVDLLKMVAPTLAPPSRRTVGDLSGGHSARYEVAPHEREDALALLESHRRPVLTAIETGCDISVCLDFYQHPAQGESDQWEPTQIGDLVYDAKYRWKQAAAAECRNRLASYIESHPVLRQLTGITAMPGSSGVTSRLLSMAARAVSRSLDVPVVDLQRIRKTEPQKDYTDSDDPDSNQRNTMTASLSDDPSLIVVLNDLMAHGSTVREASRALREAGARKVGSVTLVKDRTGTRRYVFD